MRYSWSWIENGTNGGYFVSHINHTMIRAQVFIANHRLILSMSKLLQCFLWVFQLLYTMNYLLQTVQHQQALGIDSHLWIIT